MGKTKKTEAGRGPAVSCTKRRGTFRKGRRRQDLRSVDHVQPQAPLILQQGDLLGTLIATIAALLAGASFSVSSVLQQKAARSAPASESLHLRLLMDLMHQPAWVGGVVAAIASYVLQAIALHFGPLALVQPLIVSELLFALPLAMRLRQRRLGRREWLGAVATTAGLAVFLTWSSPSAGDSLPPITSWLVAAAVVSAVVAVVIVAARGPEGPRRALLLGVGAGTVFGLLAAVTKTFVTMLSLQGAGALLTWVPVALLVAGAGGYLLAQSAFQAGPLAASLPAIDLFEPVVAVLVGMFVLHERIALQGVAPLLEIAGAGLAVLGVVTLGRSPMVLSLHEDTEQEREAAGLLDEAPTSA